MKKNGNKRGKNEKLEFWVTDLNGTREKENKWVNNVDITFTTIDAEIHDTCKWTVAIELIS